MEKKILIIGAIVLIVLVVALFIVTRPSETGPDPEADYSPDNRKESTAQILEAGVVDARSTEEKPVSKPLINPLIPQPAEVDAAGTPAEATFDNIRAAVDGQVPKIRDCYGDAGQDDPDQSSQIALSMTIENVNEDQAGITNVAVTLPAGDADDVHDCVMGVLETLRFEAIPIPASDGEHGPPVLTLTHPVDLVGDDG